MHTDWQTIATLAIGAGALAYVARRWWPGLAGLFNKAPAAPRADTGGGACGQIDAPASSGSCGSGCGNCGQATTPARDHREQRVHIVRRTTD
ncbi:MAG: hypothetical protein QM749_18520 [Aquabacterium sp.]